MNKLVIIDRDGVINHDSQAYIKSPEEWLPIEGSLEAIAALNRGGYQVVIATNQSGIARGHYDLPMLNSIHEKLHRELLKVNGQVDEIFFCPHQPSDNCECRKPKPGLMLQIQKKYNVDLKECFFIGDSTTDIQLARTVGCKPILVLTGNGAKTLNENPDMQEILHFKNLAESVNYILS